MSHYIYILQDPRKPHYNKSGYQLPFEPFYIGKGKGNRCYNWRDRSSIFKNKLNKIKQTGLLPHITKIECEDAETAYAGEIALIKAFGLKILKEGPLVNITPGGNGGFDYINTFLPNGMMGNLLGIVVSLIQLKPNKKYARKL